MQENVITFLELTSQRCHFFLNHFLWTKLVIAFKLTVQIQQHTTVLQ